MAERLSTVVIFAKLPDDHAFEGLDDVAAWASSLSDGDGGQLRDVAVFLPEDTRLVLVEPVDDEPVDEDPEPPPSVPEAAPRPKEETER